MMLRGALLVLGASAAVTAVPATSRACSGPCGDDGRFFLLVDETVSPVPRDGALVVFAAAMGGAGCYEEFAEHLRFEVRRAGRWCRARSSTRVGSRSSCSCRTIRGCRRRSTRRG